MDTSRPSPIPPDTQTAVPLEMEVPTGSGIQTSVPTAARTRVPEPRSRGRRPQLAAVPPDTQSVLPYTQFTLPRSRAVRRAIRFDGSLCDDWYDSDPDKKFGWRVCFPRTDAEVPDLIPDSYIGQFISSRGNEYFCEIDEEYLTDRFNLTGLNMEVSYYQHALDLITDVFDLDADDHLREQIEKSARHLYGLVHARYIVTTRGLAKMVSSCESLRFRLC